MKYTNYIVAIVMFVLLISCKREEKSIVNKSQSNTLIKFAKGIDIEEYESYYLLTIKTPYKGSKEEFKYILVKNNHEVDSTKNDLTIINIPIKKIIATSTTHIPMIELLEEENSLVGFPTTRFISSKKTRELVDNGTIRELGIDADLNTELVLDLNPDVLIGYAVSSTNKSFETIKQSGIPVIYNGAWLEETPIGRAEWLKLFGILYDKYEVADSIFLSIKEEYEHVKSIAKTTTSKPTILSGSMHKDVWNVPAGESFVAQYLKDANTDYIWKNTKGKGSLQLSFESVLDQSKHADIWISPGYSKNKEQLLTANKHYREFDAFKNNSIYTFANKKGATGGIIYFELAPVRPDLVLKDIIKIAHPELLPNYNLTFFDKMN